MDHKQYKYTNEAKKVLDALTSVDNPLGFYGNYHMSPAWYVLSVFEHPECVAYRVLRKAVYSDYLDAIRSWALTTAEKDDHVMIGKSVLCEDYEKAANDAGAKRGGLVDTGTLLLSFFNYDEHMRSIFMHYGFNEDTVDIILSEEIEAITPRRKKKKSPKVGKDEATLEALTEASSKSVVTKNNSGAWGINDEIKDEVLDSFTKSMMDIPDDYKIMSFNGDKELYNTIFDVLGKYNNNNVILTGGAGSGKTTVARNIAAMIKNGMVPAPFTKRRVVEMDFYTLTSASGIRGAFESKFTHMLNFMSNNGNYIVVIDDVNAVINGGKYAETPIEQSILKLLKTPSIAVLMMTADSGALMNNLSYAKYLTLVNMPEYTDDDITSIIRSGRPDIRNIEEEAVTTAIKYAKHITPGVPPLPSVLNILSVAQSHKRNDGIMEGEDDMLLYPTISKDDVKKITSQVYGKGFNSDDKEERHSLISLDERIMKRVIGQDKAVKEVCSAVRRHRVGVTNPERPAVFLAVGSTGTGKTFLAKNLAIELYGSENKLVRMDMSEYSDKTSVNKLYGSAPGYVGYEDGGILTEAVRRNGKCVLLLDEMEKADDEVYNVFLQVFDDGRLTDNKGRVVSFKDCVIIMTSNLGFGGSSHIGFSKGDSDIVFNEAIEAAIKKHFKPEFINRIDSIIYFNSLSDDALKTIISNEIIKVRERVESLGFHLPSDVESGQIAGDVFEDCKKEKVYGARPVLRSIQRRLEDAITDFILKEDPEEGYTITYEDLGVN